MLPFATEHASCRCRAMLLDAETYAFGHVELSFWTRKAMLLRLESYAFGVEKQCFGGLGAMLFAAASRFGETGGLSSFGM